MRECFISERQFKSTNDNLLINQSRMTREDSEKMFVDDCNTIISLNLFLYSLFLYILTRRIERVKERLEAMFDQVHLYA